MNKRRWYMVLGIVAMIGLSGGLDLAAAQPPPRPFPGAQPPLPDLKPVRLNFDPTKSKAYFTCTVMNVGNAPAGKFLIQGRLEKGPPPGTVVGGNEMTVSSLAPQTEVTHTFQLPATAFSKGGQYVYICVADSGKAVKESDEKNNEASKSFTWP